MAKGKNKKVSVEKKDVYLRLNFLYQAAHCALSMNPPNKDLAKHYMSTMKAYASKNVVRLSPHIKRTMCKSCQMLLLPGVSSKVRNTGGHRKSVIVHCLQCKTMKKFLLNPNHQLWHDQPENIAQVVTFNGSGR